MKICLWKLLSKIRFELNYWLWLHEVDHEIEIVYNSKIGYRFKNKNRKEEKLFDFKAL